MKKVLSLVAAAAIFFTVACSNSKKEDKAKTEEPAKTEMAEKEHVCTDKCKDGNHVYAHGEKGHVCTAECGKM